MLPGGVSAPSDPTASGRSRVRLFSASRSVCGDSSGRAERRSTRRRYSGVVTNLRLFLGFVPSLTRVHLVFRRRGEKISKMSVALGRHFVRHAIRRAVRHAVSAAFHPFTIIFLLIKMSSLQFLQTLACTITYGALLILLSPLPSLHPLFDIPIRPHQ